MHLTSQQTTRHTNQVTILWGQITGVGPLHHTRLSLRSDQSQLSIPDIHGDHFDRAILRSAIGESAGGNLDQNPATGKLNCKLGQRLEQLQSASADKRNVFAGKHDLRRIRHPHHAPNHPLPIDLHLPRQNRL